MPITREFRRAVEQAVNVRGAISPCTAGVDPTTDSNQDLGGCSQNLPAGTYLVWGVFEVRSNGAGNDRNFRGRLYVGSTVQPGWASFRSATANVLTTVAQVWLIQMEDTATVKLAVVHAGGTTGDYTVFTGSTKLLTLRIA